MVSAPSLGSLENDGSDDMLSLPLGAGKMKIKKKRALDPAYVPYEDDDDDEDVLSQVEGAAGLLQELSPPKRKLGSDEDGDRESLGDNSSLRPNKKLKKSGPPNIMVARNAILPPKTDETLAPTNNNTLYLTAPAERKRSVIPGSPRFRKQSRLEDRDYVSDNSDHDDNDHTFIISNNEKTTVVFDFTREKAKRLAGAINIPQDIYTERERDLFLQLAMRGFEPLAPKHWQFDFPTLPDSLFSTSENKSAPIIKTSRSTTFYAIKSLACLFSLSGRVRDCSILEKRPEALIKQTIEQYIRWALYDADLSIDRGSIPVHVIYAQKKNEPTLNALTRLNNRLQKLALRHHLALKETPNIGAPLSDRLPLLIGFVICGPIVAIMTFDPDPQQLDESTDGRFMSQFDLSERGQDVWNSLAIAIAVIHVRNTMIRLSQDGIGGFRRTRRSSPTDNDF